MEKVWILIFCFINKVEKERDMEGFRKRGMERLKEKRER